MPQQQPELRKASRSVTLLTKAGGQVVLLPVGFNRQLCWTTLHPKEHLFSEGFL